MTRMFKKLVESSRKRLSRALAPATKEPREPAQPRNHRQAQSLRVKPDFEPLEGRVLFSGIGTGFNKKQVTFIDAWGDSVLVRLIGGPGAAKFDIVLDGGAKNNADVQSITINGKATSSTVLDVFVKPKALTVSDTYTGGMKTYGDPDHGIYAITKANRIFTPGFVEIGSIYATTNLRGISLNGANFQNIDVTGSIGLGTRTIGGIPNALHGGISVDLGDAQFRSGLLKDPFAKADFGTISVTEGVDSLIIHGRNTIPASNNLNGSITIGGQLNSINAEYSDVLAPISVSSLGTAFFNDILANVTSAGAIGELNADNLVANVTAGGAMGSLSLTGSLLGAVEAASFTSVSVNGNFTGLLESTAGGIGSIVINSGTAFTGAVKALAGNIGNIVLSQASTPFSGQIDAVAGNIGNVTAGFFSDAALTAAGSIGNVTSNATNATVTSGIVNSVFISGAAGIGNISSVSSITNSQVEAVGGPIGNISVLQGGISGLVIGGSTTTLATSIGSITSNLSIEGTSAIASGAIGNITSIAGFIGGSANTAAFIKPGVIVTVNLGGTFNINGVIGVQGGQPGPKADVFIGGSIGNISALSDISGNVITATAGNIGSITSHEGRIAFDAVSASGNIGNIYANSQDATFAFDSAGNVLETSVAISGTSLTGYSLIPSGSAIDHSSFTAGGTIGTVTAKASAVGGYFPSGSGSSPVYMANRAIDSSVFTAGAGIGNVYALAANTTYHPAETYSIVEGIGGVYTPTYKSGLDAAIFESNFLVTATSGGTGIGTVKGIANGGPGIYSSTFHAVSGNIGNVYGRSVLNSAIYKSSIEADSGNVGIVKGITLGGNGTIRSSALNHVIITADPTGAGTIAGVYGRSAHGNGIAHLAASSGTGGITYITGISTGGIGEYSNAASTNGIFDSTAVTTGPLGNVTGATSGGSAILGSKFSAKSIGNISGISSGYGDGIGYSDFYAQHGIGNIAGSATTHAGGNGISHSVFNANTVDDGVGSIGTVTGATAGSNAIDGAAAPDGIYASRFFASGIGNISGTVTNIYGGDGIADSIFGADSSLTGIGAIGTITGATIGAGGSGILSSTFRAGAGIGNIYGGALGAYSVNGIAGSYFNADFSPHFVSAIGAITGVSLAKSGSGSGIAGSTFIAGAKIGTILGATTAPGNDSYGIGDSQFYANAGKSSETGGTGSIGSVTGTAYANAATGFHAGISGSKFIAGGGPGSTGAIGPVSGSSKVNGPAGLSAAGINTSYFVAGSGAGTLGAVTGYALAQGGQVENVEVLTTGIGDSLFFAGTGAGGTSSGAIGTITGTAISEAAFGYAISRGIDYSVIAAGGSGVGTIGTITGTATSTSHAFTSAYGLRQTAVQAATLSGGKGYISNVTGAATATSQGAAYADGIQKSGVWAGYAYGKIGNVSGAASATGEARTYAYGITGAGIYHAHSYGFRVLGGYTLKAGSGAGGSGVIGTVTGAASADANDRNAIAIGIDEAVIASGYAHGAIGNVTGTGDATAEAGSATAKGIAFTAIDAGIGYDGAGSIGNVGGYASATATSGNAVAGGIDFTTVKSGLNSGVIGTVTGKGTATVLGANQPDGFADALGIASSSIDAGYSGIYGKIGAVTGAAVAKIHSSYENPSDTADAYAAGLADVSVFAQAPLTGTALAGGTGIIGAITGSGSAYAYGYQVKATGAGIVDSHATASDGDLGTGAIAGIYGHGIAKAVSDDLAAGAYAYGIGTLTAGNIFAAGAGLDSVGKITGEVYGTADATATSVGNAPATAVGVGIGNTTVTAGIGSYDSKGYIGNVVGHANVTANGGAATTSAYGITATTIKAGRANGVIGNVYGDGTATSTSYYGNATATATGIRETYIGAGLGNKGTGVIGNVAGAGDAYAYADGAIGNATAKGYGIDPSTVSAGSNHYTGIGENVTAGAGTVESITGSGTARATAAGIDTLATAVAFGIDGLKVDLGAAYSLNGAAVAGAGAVTNGITGAAIAEATATNNGGSGSANATGISHLYVYTADATGLGYAKAGAGAVGSLTANVTATVDAANNAYVYTYGLVDVTLSAGNASAGSAPTDLAFGGKGTIGSIYQKQTATATAGKPYGVAKATAEPIVDLALLAGNAYGGAAYGGTGEIADGAIMGVAGAYATGYSATALAVGLSGVKASAGNAEGSYYATGGAGYVGQLIGTATADAISSKLFGSVAAAAKAYGILDSIVYAGNAGVQDPAATAPAIAGTGTIAGFVGTATATAYSKSPFNGSSKATAIGIDDLYAYAGDARNYGAGPAKTFDGKIGAAGPIVGTATATGATKGGGSAFSNAYATGIDLISLNAANAATYGGGAAIAKNAYAFIAGVKGYGTGDAYAYGKTDPRAIAHGYGVIGGTNHFVLRAGNAFVEHGGTSTAYAAGEQGAPGEAIIQGVIGMGAAYATAKGTASNALPVSAPANAIGINFGLVQAAYAGSNGDAYGGRGYAGLVYGFAGTAHATSTATAINASPAPATASGQADGTENLTVDAGIGRSYIHAGTGRGGLGEIGLLTGLAYSTSTATGDPARAFGSAYGILALYAGAANAIGLDAYAGAGAVGVVTGRGVATSTATGASVTATTGTSARAYGIKLLTVDAAVAMAIDDATGGTGTIGSITGSGRAIAASSTDFGYGDAAATGVSTGEVYAGDASGASAIAGLGTIGATTGAGYAKATGGAATANSNGVDPTRLYAGVAFGVTYAKGGAGSSVGAVTGTATSKAYGYAAGATAYGIVATTVLAGNAKASSATGTAIAGSGAIGAIIGGGYVTLDASDSTATVGGRADGIEDATFSAGYAGAYAATAGVGTVGAITGTATDKVTGYTSVVGGGVYADHSYGMVNVTANAGQAVGTGGSGSTATGAKGTVGNITGSIVDGLYGTVSGAQSLIYARHISGIYNLTVNAGSATAGKTAVAGPGYVATGAGISGKAALTLDGTVTSTGGYEIAAHDISGIYRAHLYAGTASATSLATSTATGATGVIGNIYGSAKSTFTGVNAGEKSVFLTESTGIGFLYGNAGTATGYASAKAGPGTAGNVTGITSAVFSGNSNVYKSNTGVQDVYGIRHAGFSLGAATASNSINTSTATGAAGKLGNVVGTASQNVTGVATGPAKSDVYADNTDGISYLTVHAGDASAYRIATAGTGAVGTVTGSSSVTMQGTTSGVDKADVYANTSAGIAHLGLFTGNAYANVSYAQSVATAAAGTVGAISGTAIAKATGVTKGNNSGPVITAVESVSVYGLDAVSITAGYATGYKAFAAVSTVGAAGITGSATVTVTATTAYVGSFVDSGRSGNLVAGIDSLSILASTAVASNSKLGVATGGAATVGYIKGVASAANTDSGAGQQDAYAYVRGVNSLTVKAGSAYGATAKAGGGTLGFVYGKATASSTSPIATNIVEARAYGIYGVTLKAGNARSTYALGIATAGASGIGAITGLGYATASGPTTISTETSTADATGIRDLYAYAGIAKSYYKAYGAASSIGALTGVATSTATGYAPVAHSYAIDSVKLHVAGAYGGLVSNSVTLAAAGAVGGIYATATATATGASALAGSGASSRATGLEFIRVDAGEANGSNPQGGIGSSVGKISVGATSSATGYTAYDITRSIFGGYFYAGDATGDGKVVAGSGSIASGSGIYVTASGSAMSNDAGAKNGHAKSRVLGVINSYFAAGDANNNSTGGASYGAAGAIGNFSVKAAATASSAVGTYATGLAYGAGNYHEVINPLPPMPLIAAGVARGYNKAYAGPGVIGALYGYGKATVTGGATTATAGSAGLGDSYFRSNGAYYVNVLAGYARAYNTSGTKGTGIAMGGAKSSVGPVTGKSFAYATANAKTGSATSHAYGMREVYVSVGGAIGFAPTAGSGSIGTVTGSAKATAAGFNATVVAKGIDPSKFSAACADTAAVGSIGAGTGIYGYGYGSGQSSGGASSSEVYGIAEGVSAFAGYGTTKSGAGAIGAVSGIAKSYALDSNKGTYTAYASGIFYGTFNAGHKGSTSSAIGKVNAIAVASNSKGGVGYKAATGANAEANGIQNSQFFSGGSIGAVTGANYQGAGTEETFLDATFNAGTSIGIVHTKNAGTGTDSDGIAFSTFVAGASISGVYAGIAATSGFAIYQDNFIAKNTGGTGATTGIGYVTAVTGGATTGTASEMSLFTTTGSIGAVNMTGSVLYSVIAAGDYLDSRTSFGKITATSGASIGAVKISGYFEASDLVASVTNSTSNYFGRTGDTSDGGAITSVNIGLPTGPTVVKPATSDNYAIEAETFTGTVVWGGTTIATGTGGSSVFDSSQYVHVQAL